MATLNEACAYMTDAFEKNLVHLNSVIADVEPVSPQTHVYSARCRSTIDKNSVSSTARHIDHAEDAHAYLTYTQDSDEAELTELVYSIGAAIYVISLTDERDNAKFSEEPAQRLQLPRCCVCGFVGHDALTGMYRLATGKSPPCLCLDTVANVLPSKREDLWCQIIEVGILHGLPPADLDQLWKWLSEKAAVKDAEYRAQAPQNRGAGQYPSQQRAFGGSPFSGPGARGRFGDRKDANGRPTSFCDPHNRPKAPIAGAPWAQRGPTQDSRYNNQRSQSPYPQQQGPTQ
jgi:hypothetical protein